MLYIAFAFLFISCICHIFCRVLERISFLFVEWRVNEVPEALSVSKMAYQTLQQEYLQIPVVTRAYTTACVLTTAAVVREKLPLNKYDGGQIAAAAADGLS